MTTGAHSSSIDGDFQYLILFRTFSSRILPNFKTTRYFSRLSFFNFCCLELLNEELPVNQEVKILQLSPNLYLLQSVTLSNVVWKYPDKSLGKTVNSFTSKWRSIYINVYIYILTLFSPLLIANRKILIKKTTSLVLSEWNRAPPVAQR